MRTVVIQVKDVIVCWEAKRRGLASINSLHADTVSQEEIGGYRDLILPRLYDPFSNFGLSGGRD
jgi:hypothetical protein